MDVISTYLWDLLLCFAAGLLAFFLFGGLLKSQDTACGPEENPFHYRVYKPFQPRRGALALAVFFGTAALLLARYGALESLVFAAAAGLACLIFLLRYLLASAWRIEVDEGQITLRRPFAGPSTFALGDVLHMTRNSDGNVRVYGESRTLLAYSLGSPKYDKAAYHLLEQLEGQAAYALARERNKEGGTI